MEKYMRIIDILNHSQGINLFHLKAATNQFKITVNFQYLEFFLMNNYNTKKIKIMNNNFFLNGYKITFKFNYLAKDS